MELLKLRKRLKIAVAYERAEDRVDYFPAENGIDALAEWQPVYVDLPGWEEDITGARRRDDLPPAAQDYVARIEDLAGVPVSFIGVGPARDQALV